MDTDATDDFDEDDCLCQGKVPKDKRVDFERRVQDPKTGAWKWKVILRYHRDCDIHGVSIPHATSLEPSAVQ